MNKNKRKPTAFLKEEYEELVRKNFDWKIRVLEGASKPRCIVDGKEILMLCSNNYLGLCNHPYLREKAIEAIKTHGVGAGSDRSISGNMDLHIELEKRLARFKGAEASLVYQTGFMVNEGLIPQLAGKGDIIISDELNHGSIIDGVRLTKADKGIYKHRDMGELEKILSDVEKKDYRRILIITDGVFSMDGDITPLDEIAKLGAEHGAMVYVDDAHGEGVLGKGKGVVAHFDLSRDEVHAEMGTFSKAFGVVGGHLSGSNDLYNFAYNTSRRWLLSGATPPSVAASCIAAIDIMEKEPQHVENLWENTKYFKKEVEKMGFDTGETQTPIIPIMTGESKKAKELSDRLFDEGIFAFPIVFPMVAKDKARIRTQMNAELTREDLDFALNSFEKIGKELSII